ncbi:TetR/AcrR family transcriptional regulator C-terminal domain-containing protein [Nocardia sp. NPDC052566]|uniref:TetR/AcrR family transcriptional regulator C-terminal domain-containing protein n=1 Tax=Nocardia sp. NPDC052566 TaxID=3364330 RepID=UPI0037C5DF11
MAWDRDQIVRIALDQLDEVGLETLSLRKLAGRLEVHPSALYYHFSNKQDLLDEMARALVQTAVTQTPKPSEFTTDGLLTHLARTQRAAIRSRRDGGLLMIKARPTADDQLEYLDWLIERLVAEGFSVTEAATAFTAVSNYAIGATVAEQQRTTDAPADPQLLQQHPGLRSIAEVTADADATFERGLRWLLDGIRAKP